jgi:hypothetical protein
MLGGFLGRHGYEVEYERVYRDPTLGEQKPEWSISKDGKLYAIAEVRNWHADMGIEEDLREWMSTPATGTSPEMLVGKKIKGMRVKVGDQSWVFPDMPSRGTPEFDRILKRLYDELQGKFGKYKDLANRLDVPYIVGLAVQFVAGGMINQQDVLDALFSDESKLFENHPEVSGLYHYADGNGYILRYVANPFGIRPLENMPEGWPRPQNS